LPEPRTPADAEPSDAELLRRHVEGDPEAFGQLFLRHRDRLWAVAVRTLSDPEEAADALQDAMISAFRRAGSFRGDSAVTTWLYRIVVNAALDRMRRRAARPAADGTDERTLDNLAAAQATPDPSSDSDTSLDVTAALRTLPPEQQAALVLVDMLGYSVADAADILGVSEGTIKSRAARGRARLLPRLQHLRGRASPPSRGKPLDTAQDQTPATDGTSNEDRSGTDGLSGPDPNTANQTAATDGAPSPDTDTGNRSATGHVLPAREGGDERR
jgi:RNA polymerase sigma-70 factor, ECF subfamily